MKLFLKINPLIIIFIAIANLSFAGTIESYRLVKDGIVVAVNGNVSAQIVLYVQEDHGRRNSTRGTIFWKKDTYRFPKSGRYLIPVDLTKAKEGYRYRVVLVNHSSGKKFERRATVRQGKFF